MARSFTCEKCNVVDVDISINQDQTICYQCDTGEWHGLFEREEFDPDVHDVDNVETDDGDHGIPSFS